MMLYTDKEIQDVSAGQGNRVRMALVESTSNIAEVDSRKNTTQNTQVQLWTLAFPVCAIIFIITVLLLNSLITPAGEVEESRANGPILLKASSSPKPSANKHSGQIFVSSIAYSDTSAIAFVNDQMVSKGDTIDGFTVLKIDKEAVEFEKNGKRWTQEVGEQPVSLW